MLAVNIEIFNARRAVERRRRLNNFIQIRRNMRNESNPFSLDNVLFIKLFRLSKNMVHELIHNLIPYMSNSNHPNAISPDTRIFTALSFFSTGSYQKLIGQSFNLSMSQQSVSNCVREVSTLIYTHLRDEYIKFPQTEEQKNQIKLTFMQRAHFPGVIGAIDCTHVAILTPRLEEHNYVNRKGYHSINVQIICDYNLKILAINALFPGATHDAFIWRGSAIKQELQRCYEQGDRSSWLLGDAGYPLQPWLMTPILDAVPDTPEGRYTASHCSARNCIERCNGVLKMRFRCLLGERVLRYEPRVVSKIIIACAILHNMCVDGNLPLNDELIEPQNNEDIDFFPRQLDQVRVLNEGQQMRQNIVRRYFA